MMTTTKTKKLHWTPDTPATMEMIEDYAGTFHTNETDDFIVAARNAAIAACKADLNALLTYDLPTKKPKTSVACYTMDEVMTKAISFYEGFIGGVALPGKRSLLTWNQWVIYFQRLILTMQLRKPRLKRMLEAPRLYKEGD